MKKIILFLLMMIPCFAFAQGNLQFSAAKFIPLLGRGTYLYVLDTTITVPANAVWKIEQFGLQGGSGFIVLNGGTVYSMGSTGDLQINSVPLWLPAGTYTLNCTLSDCVTCTLSGFISAIEFNIVP